MNCKSEGLHFIKRAGLIYKVSYVRCLLVGCKSPLLQPEKV